VLWAAEADPAATGQAGPDVVWCSRCGGYSSTRLYKLGGPCAGQGDPPARTRLARLNALRHPVHGYGLRTPIRLTDAVISQLRIAGKRQTEEFERVLRTAIADGAGGHGDDAMDDDEGEPGAQPRDTEDHGYTEPAMDGTAAGWMNLEEEEDPFGHGGSLDEEGQSGRKRTFASADGAAQPTGRNAGAEEGTAAEGDSPRREDIRCHIHRRINVEVQRRDGPTAAQRIEAIRRRVREKRARGFGGASKSRTEP
jgi:hypothetical protein